MDPKTIERMTILSTNLALLVKILTSEQGLRYTQVLSCHLFMFELQLRIRNQQSISLQDFKIFYLYLMNKNNLLNLSNINPDAGFGLQVYVDENLVDIQNVCFQAALVYTSSEGMLISSFTVSIMVLETAN